MPGASVVGHRGSLAHPLRRNGPAGVSWGTAPRLRNGSRLQADMRPARAALIDAPPNTPYGLTGLALVVLDPRDFRMKKREKPTG
jgi:hypothetical protein